MMFTKLKNPLNLNLQDGDCTVHPVHKGSKEMLVQYMLMHNQW